MGHEFPPAFSQKVWKKRWRTVHALDSRSRGLGSRPGLVIVLSLSETAYYYSSHLHPGTQMFTIELSGWLDEIL